MKQNKKIALTGGIGSGKSLVKNILIKNGKICFDCDEINANLLESKEYLAGLIKLFPESLKYDGSVDKKIIKNIIFNNSERRAILNKYSHSKIKEKLIDEFSKINDQDIFVEVPILNQTDFGNLFDEIWVIVADKLTRKKRIIDRDYISENLALSMINSQNDNYENLDNIIFIYNNDTISNLEYKILNLIKN